MNSANHEKIGFIFDLDGTLLENMEFFFKDLPTAIANHYHVPFTSDMEDYMKSNMMKMFDGKSNRGKWLMIKAILYTAKLYGVHWYGYWHFLRLVYKIYRNGIAKVKIIPGVEETLDNLIEQHNAVVGIYTTSSEEEIQDRFIGRESFLHRFNGSLIGRDSVRHPKPGPDGILTLSERWGIHPSKIVMVGDFFPDIYAGKNAGSITIGVLSGLCNQADMEKLKPDFILNSVSDILSNIDQIKAKLSIIN